MLNRRLAVISSCLATVACAVPGIPAPDGSTVVTTSLVPDSRQAVDPPRTGGEESVTDDSGLRLRVFTPSARIFFDTGTDDPDEVDVFRDGSITPTINLVELFYAFTGPGRIKVGSEEPLAWYFGPAFGFGITSPASDPSAPGSTDEASDAPVVLFSLGLLAELPLSKDGVRAGVEFGYATGYSASESLSDIDDSAAYFGINLDIRW